MTAQNALLYNAALEGFLAGQIRDRYLTAVNSGMPPVIGTPDVSYNDMVLQAANFSIELDSLIPTDDTASPQPAGTQAISVITTGVAIAPSTGAIQFGEVVKSRLLAACALSVYEGRYYGQPNTLTPSELSAVATLVKTSYLKIAVAVVQPISSPPVNNQLLMFAAITGAAAGIGAGTFGAIPSDEGSLVDQLLAGFGLAVDALIAFDSTITAASANGATAAPANSTIQQNQLAKFRLMESICLAVTEKRNPISIVGSSALTAWLSAQAPAIAALYKAAVGGLELAASTSLNPLLFNEAYCAFIAGNIAGRPITSTSTTDPNYVAVSAAAVAFATEVDAAVGASDLSGNAVPVGTQAITSGGEGSNIAIAPTTGTINEGQIGKTGLMWAICRGVQHGRPLLGTVQDTTAATYAGIAKSIVALYLLSATALTTP